MKNKEIFKNAKLYITLILLLVIVWFSYMLYNINNYTWKDNKNEVINTLSWKLNNDIQIPKINKLININTKTIDPNNYKSVEEFLTYFNTWSWIKLEVNLLEEDFYINTDHIDDTYIVTRFDKELIWEIDNSINKNIKNTAILNIFDSYKTDWYILGEANNERSWVKLLKEYELSSNMKLHNNLLLPYNWESSLEATKRLENKQNKTKEDNQQLSYLYDFSWDYKKSLKLKEKSWLNKIKYIIKWRVYKLWNFLDWAKIELLNYENISTFSNEKWEYTLEFETYPLTRLRLRATHSSSSDWYNWVYVVFDTSIQKSEDINFSLQNINTKILVKSSELINWKTKTVKSSIWNTFTFKKWVLLNENWKKYNWDFNVSIFEFDRNTSWMENYLALDNFDNLYWYTWDMMITNWMTYLLVTDLEWNELFISKKNPIITRQKVDIDYLLNNKQNWTTNLTQEQLSLILEKSKQKWYPIDNIFFSNRQITWFSPWWVLNRTRWIWENNWIKLLNKSWLKESLYYNVD